MSLLHLFIQAYLIDAVGYRLNGQVLCATSPNENQIISRNLPLFYAQLIVNHDSWSSCTTNLVYLWVPCHIPWGLSGHTSARFRFICLTLTVRIRWYQNYICNWVKENGNSRSGFFFLLLGRFNRHRVHSCSVVTLQMSKRSVNTPRSPIIGECP
jgi:hypothetical protein